MTTCDGPLKPLTMPLCAVPAAPQAQNAFVRRASGGLLQNLESRLEQGAAVGVCKNRDVLGDGRVTEHWFVWRAQAVHNSVGRKGLVQGWASAC